MKKNAVSWIHAVIVAAAAVMIFISSRMAYPLGDLNTILLMCGGCVVLDVLMATVLKKDNILRDALMLVVCVLAALSLCRIIQGRADLMGYVWFSDLEAGNPAAVGSQNLAAASMGCLLVAEIINIVSSFRKEK